MLTGKDKELGEIYSSATLPITNLMWTGLGLNPGLLSDRPVTNHLSLSMVQEVFNMYIYNSETTVNIRFYAVFRNTKRNDKSKRGTGECREEHK
jgi:hypothetical protein